MNSITELRSALIVGIVALGLASCGRADENGGVAQADDVERTLAGDDQSRPSASENVDANAASLAGQAPDGFNQCKVCHSVEADGPAGVGPNLHSIFGKAAASKAGFTFSPAMKSADIVWNAQELDAFLESPAKMIPGTKMAFAGIKDPVKRQEIVKYLESLQ
jgi:cytochrome c